MPSYLYRAGASLLLIHLYCCSSCGQWALGTGQWQWSGVAVGSGQWPLALALDP